MGFHEEQFPYYLQYGMTIKHKYKTAVITTQSLHEERVCNWLDCLRTYEITPIIFDQSGFQELGAFFRARSGRTNGFRLRDPIDHEVTNQVIGAGDGRRVYWQVYKEYSSGIAGDSYSPKRILTKLVAPVTVTVGGITRTPSVDLTTGVVAFVISSTLFAVTYGTPNTITRTDGGNFQDAGVIVGDLVQTTDGSSYNGYYAVTGFVNDGETLVVTQPEGGNVVGGDTEPFDTPVSTTIKMYNPPINTVAVSCVFDTPVRFSTNRLGTTHATFQQYNPEGIALIEDRIQSTLIDTNVVETAIPGFVEARYPFDTQLSDESEFASRYSDQLIEFDSGYEQRLKRSAQGYNDYQIKYEVKPLTEIQRLIAFFHARKGRYGGFRLKDINDYQAEDEVFGVGDDATYEFQLVKTYVSGDESEERLISKPVEDTVMISANDVPLDFETNHILVNYSTGVVSFFLDTFSSLEFIAASSIIQQPTHWSLYGVTVGMKIAVVGSALNDGIYTISALSTTDATVEETLVDEEALAVSVYLPPAEGVTLKWSGEFDVPARFNTDELEISINGFESYNGNNVGIQEIHTEPIDIIYYERPVLTTGPLICAGAASPILSPPELALDFGEATFAPMLTYNEGPSLQPSELHKTLNGITAWTFFVVLSHSKRGQLIQLPQPAVWLNNITNPSGGLHDWAIRLFIGSRPLGSDNAKLILQTWCGSVPIQYAEIPSPYCPPIYTFLAKEAEFSTPLYTHSESEVYEPMTILIVTFSYATSRAYLSGTINGVMRATGSTSELFLSYACDIHGDPPGVRTTPTLRYVKDTSGEIGDVDYPAVFGGIDYGISGTVYDDYAGGMLSARVYEAYFAQYYYSLTAQTEVVQFSALHNAIIRYLEGKYLYKLKMSLAIEGTRGHWIPTRDTLYTWDGLEFTTTSHKPAEANTYLSKWLSVRETGALNMYSPDAVGQTDYYGPLIVAIPPDYNYLETPLKGFWESADE